jgi:hypothetical protein
MNRRSPAAAIAWEFRRRHRWGFAAVAVYFVVLAAVKLFFPLGEPVNLDEAERLAAILVVPLGASAFYLLAVFSFGFSGDFAARQSIYPARMFTLPVSSAALAGWPMLYGTLAMAIVWTVTRLFAPWPSAVAVPLVWPGMMGAVLLAWTQALTWMPYGLPGLRVVAALLWLTTFDTIVLLALHFEAGEAVMLAILTPLLPLAFPAARFAVARARSGEVPNWLGPLTRSERISDRERRAARFDRPARAQAWFEWRRHGRSLPVLVGIVLPFELALLFAAGNAPALVFFILVGVLITPPVMAGFAAATVRKVNPGADGYGVTPFLATRPLTSAALVFAKLKMALWSTLAAWLLVFLSVPAALLLSDTAALVLDRASRVVEVVGAPRAVAIAVLAVAALLLATFKQLVQSLYIGLSGRERIVKASVFLQLSVLAVLGPLAVWLLETGALLTVLRAVPWILALLAGLKLCAAGWVAVRLYDARLVSDRMLVGCAAVWLVAVLGLHGLLVWLVDAPLFPNYVLLLVAILAVPLARVSAAPLALAWNRHR